MIGIALRLLPALILGLTLSLGTLFVDTDITSNAGGTTWYSQGFPFGFIEDTSSIGNIQVPQNDFLPAKFLVNFLFWTIISVVFLFILKKIRNVAGNLILVGAGVVGGLIYLGVITLL